MSDKFRTTFPIPVTFAEGEQPTNRKLNAISTQARNGLAIIERAIGDLWNQSGDTNTSDYPLHIANLARALGDQATLNSKLPLPDLTGVSSMQITQSVIPFIGKTEIALDFSPMSSSNTVLVASMTSLGYTTQVATRDLVDSDVKWAINYTSGTVYLGVALPSGTTISYSVTTLPSDGSSASGFSLIPDPLQSEWNGIKVVSTGTADKYYLVLPFRRPISPVPSSKLPDDTNNSASIGSPSTVKYWGPPVSGYAYTAGVSDARVYRYTLPEIVTALYSSPVSGTVIPTGTLYLWDNTTETVVEGLTYKIPDTPLTLFGAHLPFVIQIEGTGLDELFTGYTSANSTEASSDYQIRFSLICVGQSVSKAIESLRKELTEGSAATSFSKRVNHSDLLSINPAQGTRFPFAPPASYVTSDDHSYLLSRQGSTSISSAQRDRYNNGMFGDFLLLGTDKSQNTNVSSNKIVFNSISSGASLGFLTNSDLSGGIAGALAGSILADGNNLAVSNYPLRLRKQTLLFGTNDGITFDQVAGANIFRFFSSAAAGTGYVNDAIIGAGTLYLYGSTYDIATPQTPSSIATDLAIWTKIADNTITYKGTNLTFIGSANEDVVIGDSTHTSTYLSVYNNRLYFGDTANDDYILNSSGTFIFRKAGNLSNATVQVGHVVSDDVSAASYNPSGTTAVFGGVVQGTIVYASTGVVRFDESSDNITFDDVLDTYSFNAEGVANTTLRAGQLEMGASSIVEPPASNTLTRGLTPIAWAVLRRTTTGSGGATILSSCGLDLTYSVGGIDNQPTYLEVSLPFPNTNLNHVCPVVSWGTETSDVLFASVVNYLTVQNIRISSAGSDITSGANRTINLIVFGHQT